MVPRLAAGVSGIAWYLYLGGLPTLHPSFTTWLHNDLMQHWLGSLFYRAEPWTFPVGRIAAMPYPLGTSIGFTDSNPLLSIALKPIASILPAEFQLIGWWLLLCFFLQGYVGALLCSCVTRVKWQQAAGGALFAMSPVLAARIGHDTLCAHWLVLALLYLGLRQYASASAARRSAWLAAGCVYVASCIHPYLAIMCLALAVACLGRLRMLRLLSTGAAIGFAGVMVAGSTLLLWLIGYFGPERSALIGFGTLSADLLTFIDPREFSRLCPALHTRWGQGEGFAYFGLGGWIAVAAGIVWLVKRKGIGLEGRGIIVATAALMGLYALSWDISCGGRIVAEIHGLYRPFGSVASTFRASGRFIWPLYYLALVFGVWGLVRLGEHSRRAIGAALFGIALVAQVADFKPDRQWFVDKGVRQARVAQFELARNRYSHVALYPAQIGSDCGETNEEHVFRYGLLAYRLGMTYNSGSFARIAHTAVRRQCGELVKQVESGQLDAATIYVVSSESLSHFRRAGATCRSLDGDWVCVSANGDAAFRTFLGAASEK